MVVEKLNEPKCVSYYWCVLSATVIVLPVAECLKPARVFLFFLLCAVIYFLVIFSLLVIDLNFKFFLSRCDRQET